MNQPTELTAQPSQAAAKRMRVFACVDQSPYAPFVTDYASWAAQRLNTGLELLHAIDRNPPLGPEQDHSGAIGINEQDNLLKRIVDEDEKRSRQARESGRVFLNALRLRALAHGITEVDMRQRHGSLVESLMEYQSQIQLVVMGRRGESSDTTQRDLGRNVETVVRALGRPILTVTEAFVAPTHLMIAYDAGRASRKALDMVASSPAFAEMRCAIVMVKSKDNKDGAQQLERAKHRLESAGLAVSTHLLIGDLERLVAKSIQDLGIDLLVMGAYTHSPWRSLLMGSRTTDLLRASRVPTLLLR